MKCGLHRRIEFARQRQANLFSGSHQHNRMNTIMKNRHTAKRSQTHDTMNPWLGFGEATFWTAQPSTMSAKSSKGRIRKAKQLSGFAGTISLNQRKVQALKEMTNTLPFRPIVCWRRSHSVTKKDISCQRWLHTHRALSPGAHSGKPAYPTTARGCFVLAAFSSLRSWQASLRRDRLFHSSTWVKGLQFPGLVFCNAHFARHLASSPLVILACVWAARAFGFRCAIALRRAFRLQCATGLRVILLNFLRCIQRGLALPCIFVFVLCPRSQRMGTCTHALLKLACSGLLFSPSGRLRSAFSLGVCSQLWHQRSRAHFLALRGSLGTVVSPAWTISQRRSLEAAF